MLNRNLKEGTAKRPHELQRTGVQASGVWAVSSYHLELNIRLNSFQTTLTPNPEKLYK